MAAPLPASVSPLETLDRLEPLVADALADTGAEALHRDFACEAPSFDAALPGEASGAMLSKEDVTPSGNDDRPRAAIEPVPAAPPRGAMGRSRQERTSTLFSDLRRAAGCSRSAGCP
jgi:hypothetical protein